MAEKRRYPRNEPPTVVTVFDALEQRPLGTLGNVSGHGLMLIANGPIEEDLLMQLEFEVENGSGTRRKVRIGAESLWCSPASQRDRYWAGFEIVDIDLDDQAFLDNLPG